MNPLWMVAADLRKTVLPALGVLILLSLAFAALVTVSLYDRALRQAGAATAQDFDLVIGAPGSTLNLVLSAVYLRTDEVLPLLPFDVVRALRQDPRVRLVSPLVLADHRLDAPIVGIGPDFPALRPALRLAAGRWPTAPFETVSGSQGADLGARFFGSHGVRAVAGVEDEEHRQAGYVVVGRLEATGTPWDRAYLTPFESLWILHGSLDKTASPEERAVLNQVSAVLVKPRDFAAAYALRAQYQKAPTTAVFPGEVLAGLFGLFDDLKTVVSVLSLVLQGLVLAAVLLSLLAALPSKLRWIGLLRALGASPAYVFLTLWVQTALVLVVAGLVGAASGWAGAEALARFTASRTGLSLHLAWTWLETGFLLGFSGAGWLGALLPAWAGYRVSVRRSLLGA